jgi:hypothetical protein
MSATEQLITTIRSALDEGASPEARRAAAAACRQLLAVLDTEPGQALPVLPQPDSRPPGVPQSRVDPALLLDALIAKLKASVPDEEHPEPAPKPLSIPFVNIPKK